MIRDWKKLAAKLREIKHACSHIQVKKEMIDISLLKIPARSQEQYCLIKPNSQVKL